MEVWPVLRDSPESGGVMSQNLPVTGAAVLGVVVLVVVLLVLGGILLWIRKRGEAKNTVDGGHIRAQESESPAESPVASPSDSLPESPSETSEEHGPSDI